MAGLGCTRCGHPLPEAAVNSDRLAVCPRCRARITAEVYPALGRQLNAVSGEGVVLDTEASCYFHLRKKAAVVCDACGRFLCRLCVMDVEGQHLCPPCVEQGEQKGKLASLENQRVLYDEIALALAFAPLFVWPITLVTAPLAIGFAVRHWKAPLSIVRRGKSRFVLAIIIAAIQIGAWSVALISVIF